MHAHSATVVVDLGFGDAGKGSIVDYLARTTPASTVVRFNGGAQAAHNVITTDGIHHTFAQFGSGTLVPGVRTHLSRFMLVDPMALLNEADHLRTIGHADVFARLTVDEDAIVVTPFNKAANRFRETLRGSGRHGSCGMGIGDTMADDAAFPDNTVRVRDLREPTVLNRKLRLIQQRKYAEFADVLGGQEPHLSDAVELFTDSTAPYRISQELWRAAMHFVIVPGSYLQRLSEQGELIFEGAQGVLIDEWHGFFPYITRSTTTFANALTLLSEIGFPGRVQKLGLVRAYFTRHGPGPFPTEDIALTTELPDLHNGMNRWQREFRVGWFDTVLAKYALAVCSGADALAVTCLDRFTAVRDRRIAYAYDVPAGILSSSDLAASQLGASEGAIDRIISLKSKPVLTDLGYQATLAGILAKTTPVYRSAPSDEGQYLAMLERELGVPIVLTSYGPTAADKQFRFTDAAQYIA